MEARLARFFAIAVVVAVLGGMLLGGRARKLERQLATSVEADSMPSGPPDSARAVAMALRAYKIDHVARGEVARPARVASFATDSAGFLMVIAPVDSGTGRRASVRVQPDGALELRRLGP